MPRTVALFGGTFNPPHIGHTALANYVCETCPIDELWFMVTPCNPFKAQDGLPDDHLRYSMVVQATSGYGKFKVSDEEFSLPKPSYTVDTLAALRAKHPSIKFVLLIGADNWADFDKWKSPEAILANHDLYVYPRHGVDINPANLPANVTIVDAPIIGISSKFIRQSVAQGKNMSFFTHPSVWNIIQREKLYLK